MPWSMHANTSNTARLWSGFSLTAIGTPCRAGQNSSSQALAASASPNVSNVLFKTSSNEIDSASSSVDKGPAASSRSMSGIDVNGVSGGTGPPSAFVRSSELKRSFNRSTRGVVSSRCFRNAARSSSELAPCAISGSDLTSSFSAARRSRTSDVRKLRIASGNSSGPVLARLTT